MPTVAELQIILQAQDNASAQLRRLSGDVQRLHQQVEGVQRTSARGGLLGGLQLGAGVAAVQGAFRALGGVFDFVGESIFGMNARLERAVAQFTVFTGSALEAQRVIDALRREADVTPFNTQEVIEAGAALSTVARAANTDLLELVRTAEALAASQPTQGLEGAAFALREAVLGGDFQSIIDRFNLSRVTLNRLREEGVPALQAVQAAMQEVGATREQLEAFGRTFEGRLATVRSFGDELRQRLGAGVFERVGDFLGRLVRLIETSGDRLRAWADAAGEAIGRVLEVLASRFVGPLLALLERLAPGITEIFQGALAQAPERMERFAGATERAAQAGETLERRLARAGVEAATVQLEADRVRRAYDDQLEPLERQLRLLQQSADLQRVQNALATNRATVEGIRLEREIAALQRAARGQEDPNAPGLTLRQRLIALALQERRLQQEQLGLEEERRPLVQSLQERIAAIQEQQRQALEPLERQLDLQRDRIAQLQVERQQRELATQEAVAGVQRVRDAWTAGSSPEALADAKRRGEELADEWLAGWQEWIDANGGNLMTALWRSFQRWYDGGGRERLQQLGTDFGTALGEAAAAAAGSAIGQGIRQRIEQITAGSSAAQIADEVARGMFTGPAGAGASGGGGSAFGGEGMNVNVNVNGADPGVAQRFRAQLQEQIDQFIRSFFAAEAATDPGASGRLQGAGRTP